MILSLKAVLKQIINYIVSSVVILLCISCTPKHNRINQLTLIKAYEVITNGEFEPSGLTYWDGVFYTVSDKHNDIFKLRFDEDQVHLDPVISIDNAGNGKFDFEGISHDEEYFYLASERYFQVLKVSKDGSEVYHLSKDDYLESVAKDSGLFQQNNAHLEGICLLSTQKMLLVAERQPRGIIHANIENSDIHISDAYISEESYFPSVKNRSLDFSAASCDEGVFLLERNADMMTQYKTKNGRLYQHESWRFDHIINQPHNQYQDMEFGHAEGLVVNGKEVFVILDNNKSFHKDGRNNNALFLKMSR